MQLFRVFAGAFLALSLFSGCASSFTASRNPGFYVEGRFLYDRCGNKVILRGINEMIVWGDQRDGAAIYPEIAKTGANVVRIVWSKEGTASELHATIKNALAQKLIPMVENHNATGDLTKVPAVVDYWLRPDVVAVLTKYQDKILLNVANESGNRVTQADFESTYTTAISRLRAGGYTMPLVIDAPGYGRDIDILLAAGPTLIAGDPLANVLLSTHVYWNDPNGEMTRARLADAVARNLPLIVGEFADSGEGTCRHGSYDVISLMAAAQQHQIGWLAWSWGAIPNKDCQADDIFDMTSDGTVGGLKGWGLLVATTDANSIKNTSVLSPYIANGSCK